MDADESFIRSYSSRAHLTNLNSFSDTKDVRSANEYPYF